MEVKEVIGFALLDIFPEIGGKNLGGGGEKKKKKPNHQNVLMEPFDVCEAGPFSREMGSIQWDFYWIVRPCTISKEINRRIVNAYW